MEIYLELIYRETHLNLFLIRIKIQLLVISFGRPRSTPNIRRNSSTSLSRLRRAVFGLHSLGRAVANEGGFNLSPLPFSLGTADIPMVVATSSPSGHSSGSTRAAAAAAGGSPTTPGQARATKQINRNKTSTGDSPPTYSLAQQQQQQQFHEGIHLLRTPSPSNLHRSDAPTSTHHLYHQRQQQVR